MLVNLSRCDKISMPILADTKTAKQKMGDFYEMQACQLFIRQGLRVCQTNYVVAGVGEIDIIAEHHQLVRGRQQSCLVFAEVRSRKAGRYADALASVTPAKQRKIIQSAECFLQQNPQYQDWACRFDVVGFVINHQGVVLSCDWIENAFLAE